MLTQRLRKRSSPGDAHEHNLRHWVTKKHISFVKSHKTQNEKNIHINRRELHPGLPGLVSALLVVVGGESGGARGKPSAGACGMLVLYFYRQGQDLAVVWCIIRSAACLSSCEHCPHVLHQHEKVESMGAWLFVRFLAWCALHPLLFPDIRCRLAASCVHRLTSATLLVMRKKISYAVLDSL